jgi:hypothetical protein
MTTTTTDPRSALARSRSASAEEARAALLVQEAEEELTRRRQEADERAASAKLARMTAEQAEQRWRQDAAGELRAFGAEVNALLRAEVPDGAVTGEARGLARAFLHGGADDVQRARLSRLDPRLADLMGKQMAAGQVMVRLAGLDDEAVQTAADRVETACWRAVVARLRYLAGED